MDFSSYHKKGDHMFVRTGLGGIRKRASDLFKMERLLLLFTIVLALVTFGDALYYSILAVFFKEFGIPVENIGFFISLFFLALSIVSIPAGFISDRVGRKLVITVSLIFLAFVVFGYSVAHTNLQMGILRLLHGASFAFIFPIARAFVMDRTTEENRGMIMGAYIFVLSLSQMAAPTIGGVLRDITGSFDILFYIAAALTVGAALFLIVVVRNFGTGFEVRKMKLPTRELIYNRSFMIMLLMFAMLFFGAGILIPVTSIYATQELGMNFSGLGFLFSIYALIYATSQFVAGALSDKYGRKNLLVYPLLLYAVGMLLAGLSVNALMFFLAYTAFVAVGNAPYSTVAYSLIGDEVRTELRGTASGAITTVQNASLVLGPLLGSALAGAFNLRVPYFITSCVAFATIIMLFILLPKDKGKVGA
jgi:DHA1 family multidrug resistance protein-like MFS transporter